MKNNADLNREFCIEINFKKHSRNPSRIFTAASNLINALENTDNVLLDSIDNKIKAVTVLEDLEVGSIRIWLANVIEKTIDDEALKDLDYKKIIGKYLVKAKYAIVDFLNGKTRITNKNEIDEIQKKLLEIAKQTDVKKIPYYHPINNEKLIKGIGEISKATKCLEKGDEVRFITPVESTTFNIDFDFSPESIEELLTKETITQETTMILKVKKPDYLGESQWQFKHDTKTIDAKIMDEVWLKKFQERNFDVRPGDSLRVRVQIKVNYSHDNEVLNTHYNILSVFGVIMADPGQGRLFEKT